MTASEIKVHHEWGTLQETIVGTAVSLRVLTWSDEYAFLTPEVQQFVKGHQGMPLKDADPDLHERSVSQMEAFTDLLRSLGVVVHRAEPLTNDETEFRAELSDQLYSKSTDSAGGAVDKRLQSDLIQPQYYVIY